MLTAPKRLGAVTLYFIRENYSAYFHFMIPPNAMNGLCNVFIGKPVLGALQMKN
jgi:hypothetical protein